MVILPGITNSWTRNLPGKCFSAELQAQGRDIYTEGTVIPPGITRSRMLIVGKIKLREKSSEW
jgi:hypothetical protein